MHLNAMLQSACSCPTPFKLMSLIMRVSDSLQYASMGSSCDWEWDILDIEASCIMALQLALDLQNHWLTPVQLNRQQPWMSLLSSLTGPCGDPDRFSDGSSNQTARMAGELQGHEWQVSASHCLAPVLSVQLWAALGDNVCNVQCCLKTPLAWVCS